MRVSYQSAIPTYPVEVERRLVIIGLLPQRHRDNGLNNLNGADGLGESPHKVVTCENNDVLVNLVVRQRLRCMADLVNVSGANAHWGGQRRCVG